MARTNEMLQVSNAFRRKIVLVILKSLISNYLRAIVKTYTNIELVYGIKT